MKYFPQNLKYLRENKGLNQGQIADFIGIERSNWSNYENNKSFPNLNLFHKIVSYFGVNAGDLLDKDLSNSKVLENPVVSKNQQNSKENSKVDGKVLPQNSNIAPVLGVVVSSCSNCQVLQNTVIEKERVITSQQIAINALQLASNQLQQRVQELEYKAANPKKGVA